MSSQQIAMLFVSVWFVGIFVTAYIVGRFGFDRDTDGWHSPEFGRITAGVWPFVIVILALVFIWRALTWIVVTPITIAVEAGERGRARANPPKAKP
jgi:hypothetical protein